MSKQYKLCYVDDNILYFTDDFKHCWGDDFDDAPYEHNAGEPYESRYYKEDLGWTDEQCTEHGATNIRKIAFDFYDGYNIQEPKDGHYNSPYSVQAINKKAVPWLYNEEAGALFAGATMAEAKRWLKKAGVLWGELHE